MPSPIYKNTNLRELRDFLLSCDIHFNTIDEPSTGRRIAVAASYLREDPANRMNVATLRLKEARQAERQSVREFANYLDELEEDIPEMSEEERRAWNLLNGLKKEVCSEVLREERTIRSRE